MSDSRIEHRYSNRLLTLIAAILLIGALKAAFAVVMPIAFAAIIVAALWPLKRRLARHMPSWLAYTLTLLSLVAILGAFAAVEAFNKGDEWLDAALSTIESNAHYLKTILNSQIPAAKYEVPKCSYLAWVDVSNLNLGEDPSAVFLEKGKVAFNAGKIYGPNSSKFVRINLATSESVLAEAVNRMAKSL